MLNQGETDCSVVCFSAFGALLTKQMCEAVPQVRRGEFAFSEQGGLSRKGLGTGHLHGGPHRFY